MNPYRKFRAGRDWRPQLPKTRFACPVGEVAPMNRTTQFVVVILVGAVLLVWLVLATRYFYYENERGVAFRNDGWTGKRQVRRCHDEPAGSSVLRVVSPSEQVGHRPLSADELARVNQLRQEHHLPKVDQSGRALVSVCRWVDE